MNRFHSRLTLRRANRVVAIVVLLCAGCGGPHADLTPVQGTVTVDGKPLARGRIFFEQSGTRPASGKIRDGQILEVTSYLPSDGAPVGLCRIAIQAEPDELAATGGFTDPGQAKLSRMIDSTAHSVVPERYAHPGTSQLEIEIQPNMPPISLELRGE